LNNIENLRDLIIYQSNNNENISVEVLYDDITKDEVKKKIIEVAKEKEVDIVCGGPPCQGFSYAGKRFIDDPRNQLFKHFIEVV